MLDFKLVSEFVTIHRRDFELADPTLLKPASANPLVLGEWLELDAAYKMARFGALGGPGGADPGVNPASVFFAEQGRYDTQAIGKGPFLYMQEYEADTKIFDGAAGAGITAIGQALEVADVSIGGVIKRGLVRQNTGYIVGRVSRLPAANNQFLRFRSVNG